MQKLKYVIYTPRNNSGGVIALHNLCNLLINQGEDAKVLYVTRFTGNPIGRFAKLIYPFLMIIEGFASIIYNTYKGGLGNNKLIIKRCKTKWFPFIGKNTVVIYPDIVFGNPLCADNVVRWLLYYNSQYKFDKGRTIGYSEKDLFFAYREIFHDTTLNPECKVLCTPYFDLDLYKRYNYGERHGKCYVLRKGKWRVKPEDVADGIVVDNLPEREKVRVFNECEYCISYDTQTAYSGIAAMCGCISVVVPEECKTREDYRPNGEIGYGVAFGFSDKEIQFAISTRDKIMEYYKSLNQESVKQAQDFIDECEKYFNI